MAITSGHAEALSTHRGALTLVNLTTGIANTAFGHSALRATTTGSSNVAVGASTLRFNTAGKNNVALGTLALYRNANTSDNTAVGVAALQNNLAHGNTAFGRGAAAATGDSGPSRGPRGAAWPRAGALLRCAG